jgi:hypothetical protein
MPLVFEELRRLVHQYIGLEEPGHKLETAALGKEAS